MILDTSKQFYPSAHFIILSWSRGLGLNAQHFIKNNSFPCLDRRQWIKTLNFDSVLIDQIYKRFAHTILKHLGLGTMQDWQ
jgi:hypothetical protein